MIDTDALRALLTRCREFIDTTTAPAYPAGADIADEIDATMEALAAPKAPQGGHEARYRAALEHIRDDAWEPEDISAAEYACAVLNGWPAAPAPQHAPGMAVQALAGEIVEALLADEKDGGYDLTAGLFGPAFSKLVRRWAAVEFSAPSATDRPELLTDERITRFLQPWHTHDDDNDRADIIRAVRAMLRGTEYHSVGDEDAKDSARWRFTRDNHLQFFEPTKHWRLTTPSGTTIREGRADSYESAVDAAMLAPEGKQLWAARKRGTCKRRCRE